MMLQLKPSRRIQMFLSSAPNIAGCALALGGLGLFFGGVIHQYWAAIAAGLYAAGFLGWPRSEQAKAAAQAEQSSVELMRQLGVLADSVYRGLPNEARELLTGIRYTLEELLPRLKDLQGRGIISAKDSFMVSETVRRYLPDTLGAYLRLPRQYAEGQGLADGRTAAQTLVDQLRVLHGSLQDLSRFAFAGDAEKLVSNGQFLESRFSGKAAFRP